ncbi:MAG: PaaI family thioesterase, partial [Anaerolineales bacterium]
KQPNSRMCFICGLQNPVGLKLAFFEDPAEGQVRVDLTVPDRFQGYPGVVHGGIVTAVLDEVAVRAAMIETGHEQMMATAKMEIRFRQPTPTEEPLVAVGWVTRTSRVGTVARGEIRLADGTVTAECEALHMAVPAGMGARWEAEKEYWRVYE